MTDEPATNVIPLRPPADDWGTRSPTRSPGARSVQPQPPLQDIGQALERLAATGRIRPSASTSVAAPRARGAATMARGELLTRWRLRAPSGPSASTAAATRRATCRTSATSRHPAPHDRRSCRKAPELCRLPRMALRRSRHVFNDLSREKLSDQARDTDNSG